MTAHFAHKLTAGSVVLLLGLTTAACSQPEQQQTQAAADIVTRVLPSVKPIELGEIAWDDGKVTLPDVAFRTGSAKLSKKACQEIKKLVEELLSQNYAGNLQVDAYADGVGTKDFNLQLTRERAASVQSELKKSGFTGTIKTVPHGMGGTVNGKVAKSGVEDQARRVVTIAQV